VQRLGADRLAVFVVEVPPSDVLHVLQPRGADIKLPQASQEHVGGRGLECRRQSRAA
jgi:hypothetical protein